MSKSKPSSCIDLPEDENTVKKKIMRAKTGGRDTIEEQKEKGGKPEECMVFELYKQHLIEDDKELDEIYQSYKAGQMTSGELKVIACDKMTAWMNDFVAKLEAAKKIVPDLEFLKF